MEQTSSYSSAGQENSCLFSMKSKVSSQCWKEFASGPCPETDYSSPRFHIPCMWDYFNITYPKVIVSGNSFLHLQREDAPYVATGTCITWLWSFCIVFMCLVDVLLQTFLFLWHSSEVQMFEKETTRRIFGPRTAGLVGSLRWRMRMRYVIL
jgi:hypothetical protein